MSQNITNVHQKSVFAIEEIDSHELGYVSGGAGTPIVVDMSKCRKNCTITIDTSKNSTESGTLRNGYKLTL